MKKRKVATRDDMARIAQSYDTAMSRAMCRALGLPMPKPRRGKASYRRPSGTYDGLEECFENRRRVRL